MTDTQINSCTGCAEPQHPVAAPSAAQWLLPPSLVEVERLVGVLLASWQPGAPHGNRRGSHRTPFDAPLMLTPVDESSGQPCGPACTVQGKNISRQGLSFVHDTPLPHRNVHLSLDLPDASRTTLLLRLNWCRFTREGVYESGGKFLRAIAAEFTPPPNVNPA